MIEPIHPVGVPPVSLEPAQPVGPKAPLTTTPGSGDKTFKDILAEAVGEVQRLQNEADTTIRNLVSGELKDVTEAMVAVERADIAFQTMMLVRNKMVAAYEEIMRMQV